MKIEQEHRMKKGMRERERERHCDSVIVLFTCTYICIAKKRWPC
jgi:hypothetical protein